MCLCFKLSYTDVQTRHILLHIESISRTLAYRDFAPSLQTEAIAFDSLDTIAALTPEGKKLEIPSIVMKSLTFYPFILR